MKSSVASLIKRNSESLAEYKVMKKEYNKMSWIEKTKLMKQLKAKFKGKKK